jgi:hypothetical protein
MRADASMARSDASSTHEVKTPSTFSSCPVIKSLSGEDKNSTVSTRSFSTWGNEKHAALTAAF